MRCVVSLAGVAVKLVHCNHSVVDSRMPRNAAQSSLTAPQASVIAKSALDPVSTRSL